MTGNSPSDSQTSNAVPQTQYTSGDEASLYSSPSSTEPLLTPETTDEMEAIQQDRHEVCESSEQPLPTIHSSRTTTKLNTNLDPFQGEGLMAPYCAVIAISGLGIFCIYWILQAFVVQVALCSPDTSIIVYLAGIFATFGLPTLFGLITTSCLVDCIPKYEDFIRRSEVTACTLIGCCYVLLMGLVFTIAALQWNSNVCWSSADFPATNGTAS